MHAIDPPKIYVLRSTLPAHLIDYIVSRKNEDLVVEVEEDPAADVFMEDIEEYKQSEGYLRDYKREEGGAYGLLGVILGLILLSNKALTDGQSSLSLPFPSPTNLNLYIQTH